MKKILGMTIALCLALTLCVGAAALDSNAVAATTLESVLNTEQFTPIVHNGTVYLPIQVISEFLSKIFNLSLTTENTTTALPTGATNNTTTSSASITLEQAKAIAKAKAPSTATVVKCELDEDDGRWVYELELRDGRTEYECDINAVTGVILDWEVDTND